MSASQSHVKRCVETGNPSKDPASEEEEGVEGQEEEEEGGSSSSRESARRSPKQR